MSTWRTVVTNNLKICGCGCKPSEGLSPWQPAAQRSVSVFANNVKMLNNSLTDWLHGCLQYQDLSPWLPAAACLVHARARWRPCDTAPEQSKWASVWSKISIVIGRGGCSLHCQIRFLNPAETQTCGTVSILTAVHIRKRLQASRKFGHQTHRKS